MSGATINAEAAAAAALAALTTVAEGIADTASQRYQQHELRPGGKAAPYVEIRDGHPVVRTDWFFAHIDEWGGPSVRSDASAAMRSAAAEAGKFTPSEK